MSFDYEQSIWGQGTANLNLGNPTSIRLSRALKAIQSLPAGSKVLEFGCGAGQFIRAIKKLCPELDCYGCDISNSALEVARQAQDKVKYELSNSERSSYQDNNFDAVLIFDVLEHVANPQNILAEIHRILKPGGIMFAFVPCEGDGTSLWRLLDKLGLKKDLTKRFAGHIQYFSRKELASDLQTSGFEIVSQSFSEHILGQIVGVAAFVGMALSSRQNFEQLNNEQFFESKRSSFYRAISSLGNSLIYFESVLFSRIPSPNVHVVAQKI